MGVAAANFLLGQPAWVATATDLAVKLQDGSATEVDVAELFEVSASTLAGFGVLAGLASPIWLPVTGTAGALLWMYKNLVPEETKNAVWNGIFSTIFEHPLVQLQRGQSWSELQHISPSSASLFATANALSPNAPAAPRRDPLSFDLDGDGIETIGIDTANPILFDHTGSGVKTATGWLGADDAFLALDRNGNGSIDSGRELFGDSTLLPDGSEAVDGFAALAAEDTNADGVVDAQDAHFTSLRLWTDLDQDGITDAGELQTLTAAGIASITVAKTENAILLPNGNQIADLGTYTRIDGTVVASGGLGRWTRPRNVGCLNRTACAANDAQWIDHASGIAA